MTKDLKVMFDTEDDNDLIVQTAKGTVLRTHVAQISLSGRATQGVIIVKIKDDPQIKEAEKLYEELNKQYPLSEIFEKNEIINKIINFNQ